ANKVCEIYFSDDGNIKEEDKMFVGITTQGKMMKMLNDGDLDPQQVQRFYDAVGAFYRAAAQYAVAKLPFHDKVLENSRFVNFEKRREHEFTMVEFFLQRFPDHLEMSVEEQEKLQEQFIDYQLLSNDNIPPTCLE
ncbi:Hypothetical predicted protein, partial [Paramuricea clavata]